MPNQNPIAQTPKSMLRRMVQPAGETEGEKQPARYSFVQPTNQHEKIRKVPNMDNLSKTSGSSSKKPACDSEILPGTCEMNMM